MYHVVCVNGNYLCPERNCPSWDAFLKWAYHWCDQQERAARLTMAQALEWILWPERVGCLIVPAA